MSERARDHRLPPIISPRGREMPARAPFGAPPFCRILVLLAALLVPVGCGRPDPDREPKLAAQVLDFGPLFSQNCAGCHGAEGKLGPAPPLNDPLFLAMASEEDLKTIVGNGRPGTLMPAFGRDAGGSLTPEQVDALAKGLLATWSSASSVSAGSLPKYHAPADAPGNAQAGAAVFANSCAMCHGDRGEGTAMAGALNDPAFLALISEQALRRIVITGRPDLGMPDFRRGGEKAGKPLSERDIEDVVALLSSWKRPIWSEQETAQNNRKK